MLAIFDMGPRQPFVVWRQGEVGIGDGLREVLGPTAYSVLEFDSWLAGDLEVLEADARYYHDRVALLRARLYRWGPGSNARLEDSSDN